MWGGIAAAVALLLVSLAIGIIFAIRYSITRSIVGLLGAWLALGASFLPESLMRTSLMVLGAGILAWAVITHFINVARAMRE